MKQDGKKEQGRRGSGNKRKEEGEEIRWNEREKCVQ
jgi:hypothetical protein